ncbi:heavy-metal-associated domain-containing protein [Mobilisporobacter senegalensis]|uniref:Heavy-metal-associated domain-containing protein n=1 Tax=Mobilisporobacter senegalensis TaxID=1329262 RepID=A0A3N1XVM1_9FIRM|nr:heavy-metal-associated domain-containing protein [Mobilisporobacter senegalensis]ROR30646.1 heavy-metal-associated domain-containing protein [Mobilisporobacter senegalensis]
MKKSFRLDGLCCGNCASKIEREVGKLDGVTSTTVNFMTTKMVIEGEDEKIPDIIAAAEKIIKKIEPDVVMKKA